MTPAAGAQTATDTLSAPLASGHWPMRGSNSYQQPSTVSGEAQVPSSWRTTGVTTAVEMAPVWTTRGDRGVVSEGPVGAAFLGRSRLFRYEVRCWHGGSIPDLQPRRGSRPG